MAELPGKELAQELMAKSREEARSTPMEAVIQAVKEGNFSEDQAFRLIGRLWTCERLFYYIYGEWGRATVLNDLPPSPKYLLAKQALDESTHEMIYMDTMLRRSWVATQQEAFRHPYGQYILDSALSTYAFSLMNLGTYPHVVRVAALNLGTKIWEMGWMEGLTEVLPDEELKAVFTSQFVENRSHINMGRRIVEELAAEPLHVALCRWANDIIKRDYRVFLQELSDFVLGRERVVQIVPPVAVD